MGNAYHHHRHRHRHHHHHHYYLFSEYKCKVDSASEPGEKGTHGALRTALKSAHNK